MAWTVERAAAANVDVEPIFDFLFRAALDFGKPTDRAFEQAARRVRAIGDAAFRLGAAPRLGTLMPQLLPGLRRVIRERAIIYFDTDETAESLRVLAIFFGGQDHQRRMLLRLLGGRDRQPPPNARGWRATLTAKCPAQAGPSANTD